MMNQFNCNDNNDKPTTIKTINCNNEVEETILRNKGEDEYMQVKSE
jgi:hypothetical protein